MIMKIHFNNISQFLLCYLIFIHIYIYITQYKQILNIQVHEETHHIIHCHTEFSSKSFNSSFVVVKHGAPQLMVPGR